MSFLSALYLAGVAAVAAPIFIHMIRRAPRDNFKFSTLRFLSSSPETVSKRSRIQHILLLLLRALAVILIALAFARPYFVTEDDAAGNGKVARVHFLVDLSASMNREGVRDKLMKKLEERLARVKETDLMALSIYERISHGKFGFKNWKEWPVGERKERTLQYFKKFHVGWAESNPAVSFIQTADSLDRHLDEFGGDWGDLEVFTDGQAAEGLDELRSFAWPERINLIVHTIESSPENASISLVNINPENMQVKVKIENPEKSKELSLWVELKSGEIVAAAEAMVLQPGQTRFHVFDLKLLPKGVDKFTVQLSGDKERYDNQLYCIIPKIEKKKTLWLKDNSERDKAADFYFNVLCESRSDLEVSFDESELKQEKFNPALLVIDRPLGEGELEPVKKYMDNGGTVLFLVNDSSQKFSLESLSGEKVNIKNVQAPDYYLLSGQRFDHWLFQPFSESKFKDFSTIYFWNVRELTFEEDTKFSTLALLDENIPAVLSRTYGKGELILMTSSWGKSDSQLALNSKFIPFINALVTASSRHRENKFHYISGDPKIKELTGDKGAWKGPLPGFYEYKEGEATRSFAINLSPSESKMKFMENVDYEKAGIPFIKDNLLAKHEKSRYEQVSAVKGSDVKNQNIWRYLLVAAVIILLAESLIAHTTHKKMEQAA